MAVYKAPDGGKRKNPSQGKYYRSPSGKHSIDDRKTYYKQKEAAHKKKRNYVVAVIVVLLLIAAVIFSIVLIGRGCNAEQQQAVQPTQPTTAPTEPTVPLYTPAQVNLPELEDNGADGYMDDNIYIWNAKGFDLFLGNENSALSYANALSSFKEALGNDITVYNMVVPNHTEFGLPTRLSQELNSNPQRDNTTVIYSNYSAAVIPVDIYNAIGQKRNDYMYFNTDPRWTSLGAYYAYTVFAQTAGFEPVKLDQLEQNTLSDFAGSYVTSTWNEDLMENLDTIDYYTPSSNIECSLYRTDEDGHTSSSPEKVPLYKEITDGEDYYSVFLHGDNARMVIDNKDLSDGKKLALVKDAYGNAIAPFLCENYDEVHVIDFRYFDGNLKDYCTENKIEEVLFLNGIMSANSALQVENLSKLFQ
ncbi:MAG TPA: hypothetical protein IAD34_04135 [Candidatus Scatovicinus merdipullorum]|nr:hypothetical protein [Candidatus Scatovicinus merdipullorum]